MTGPKNTRADVLVVARSVPEIDRAAGHLRLYLLLQMLARRHEVMFLGGSPPSEPQAARYIRALEEVGIEVHLTPQASVGDLLDRVDLCVLFEFFQAAERTLGRVRMLRPDLPIVIDSVDVHFVREARGAQYARRPWLAKLKAGWTKRRELRIYRQADLILTVTETDRAAILQELPEARVAVIPAIQGVRDIVPDFDQRKRNSLLFIGGFRHPPNVDAVLFFCREILPLVRQTLADVMVTIVGDRPPKELVELASDGIVVLGWVPDTVPYLDSHCLAIAPLRFGAGMKGKVVEALAAGLPTVTTSIGAEGMELEHGKTAMIADSPEAFAEAVIRACTDQALHQFLSKEGRAHARRRWDPEVIETRVIQAIESLRHVTPKSLSVAERIVDMAQDAYTESWLARRLERAASVATWYAKRMSGTHRE